MALDHVPYAVQRGSKTASKAAVLGSHCPQDVAFRCKVMFGLARPISHRVTSPLCDYKGPLPPSPTTLTAFYPLLYFVTALSPSP